MWATTLQHQPKSCWRYSGWSIDVLDLLRALGCSAELTCKYTALFQRPAIRGLGLQLRIRGFAHGRGKIVESLPWGSSDVMSP